MKPAQAIAFAGLLLAAPLLAIPPVEAQGADPGGWIHGRVPTAQATSNLVTFGDADQVCAAWQNTDLTGSVSCSSNGGTTWVTKDDIGGTLAWRRPEAGGSCIRSVNGEANILWVSYAHGSGTSDSRSVYKSTDNAATWAFWTSTGTKPNYEYAYGAVSESSPIAYRLCHATNSAGPLAKTLNTNNGWFGSTGAQSTAGLVVEASNQAGVIVQDGGCHFLPIGQDQAGTIYAATDSSLRGRSLYNTGCGGSTKDFLGGRGWDGFFTSDGTNVGFFGALPTASCDAAESVNTSPHYCGPISPTPSITNNQPFTTCRNTNRQGNYGGRLYAAYCGASHELTGYISTADGGMEVSLQVPQSSAPAISTYIHGDRYYVFYTNVTSGKTLDFHYSDNPVPVIDYEDDLAVTGLMGFSAHPFFGAGIIKVNSPTYGVKTIDPLHLDPALASADTPNCGQTQGIVSYQKQSGSSFVGYIDCDSNSDANVLKIRSAALTDPDVSGTVCSGEGFCNFDLVENSGLLGIPICPGNTNYFFPAKPGQIGNILSVPISYETGHERTSTFDINQVSVGFVYHNIAPTIGEGGGQFGVFVVTMREGIASAKSCGFEVPFAPIGSITQLCSWRDPQTGNNYVAGAAAQAGSRVWKVDVDPKFDSPFIQAPEVSINVVHSLPSPYNKLYAVACGGSGIGTAWQSAKDIIVQNDLGNIYRLNVTGPQVKRVWGPIQGDATAYGLSMSGDGRWFSYLRQGKVMVANATNGATTTALLMPPGNYIGMQMHDTGQAVLLATSQHVVRYDIHTTTTVEPVAAGTRCNPNNPNECILVSPAGDEVSPDGPGSPTPDVSGGLPGVNTAAFSAAMGITSEAGGWLLGLLFIAAIAAGFYFTMGRSVALGGVGGFVGMGATVAFGLLPLWVILVLVLVAATVLVMRMRGGGA